MMKYGLSILSISNKNGCYGKLRDYKKVAIVNKNASMNRISLPISNDIYLGTH